MHRVLRGSSASKVAAASCLRKSPSLTSALAIRAGGPSWPTRLPADVNMRSGRCVKGHVMATDKVRPRRSRPICWQLVPVGVPACARVALPNPRRAVRQLAVDRVPRTPGTCALGVTATRRRMLHLPEFHRAQPELLVHCRIKLCRIRRAALPLSELTGRQQARRRPIMSRAKGRHGPIRPPDPSTELIRFRTVRRGYPFHHKESGRRAAPGTRWVSV
jgi:hypothetical protein